MLFNDLLLVELIILISIFFYTVNTNLMMLLYTAGIYLMMVGVLCLLGDGDIYIGFLWVIDLGVGLIFFIFILHFTSFLYQKSQINLSFRHFLIFFSFVTFLTTLFYFFALKNDDTLYGDLSKSWSFKITNTDYYLIFFSNEVTELNMLKDTYFLLNSFEFFVVNFSLLFGLFSAIFLCFIIHRVFNFMNFSQVNSYNILKFSDSNFFIRNQNYTSQQNTPSSTRIWSRQTQYNNK